MDKKLKQEMKHILKVKEETYGQYVGVNLHLLLQTCSK